MTFRGRSGIAAVVLVLLVTVSVQMLVPTAVSAADTPPQTLHKVGDHWTAWDPPVPPPDALYKMGESFERLNERGQALAVYDELVRRYPDTAAATLAGERKAKLAP